MFTNDFPHDFWIMQNFEIFGLINCAHCLGMNIVPIFLGEGVGAYKMNIWHPGQLKKLKSWGWFWSYQLNSTANLAHLPRNRAKWAELAVLFSW